MAMSSLVYIQSGGGSEAVALLSAVAVGGGGGAAEVRYTMCCSDTPTTFD
jgi:hypothetical protein